MTDDHSLNKVDRFVLGGLGILVVIVFILMLRDVAAFGVDDSFIFFRYAENVANGHGFVFNPGEPAGEGFTSWMWLLMLALFHYIGMNIILVSKVIGIFFHLMGGVLVFLLVLRTAGKRPVSKITAGILTAGFLLNYRLNAHSVSGMETSLYIFLLVLLIYVTILALQSPAAQDRWWLMICLCVLGLFFLRPEGIVAGGISLLALGIHQRKRLLKPMIWLYVFTGLIVPLVLFISMKLFIFGGPLPHSYYHKLIGENVYFNYSIRHFLSFIKTYGWLIAAAVFSMIHIVRAGKRQYNRYLFFYPAVLFLVMISIYLLFYPAMNYLHRFYIPYLPLLLVMIGPLLQFFLEKINRVRHSIPRLSGTAILLVSLVLGMNIGLESSMKNVRFWAKMVNPKIYRAKLGKIMSHLPPGVTVANTEMGVIPYYSGLTCIDMAGLIDPVITHNGLSMEYLEERGVDLILFPKNVERLLKEDKWEEHFRRYKAVFLSPRFKDKFVRLGTFAAWPGGKKYYLYADKTSPRFAAMQQWQQKFAAGPEQ